MATIHRTTIYIAKLMAKSNCSTQFQPGIYIASTKFQCVFNQNSTMFQPDIKIISTKKSTNFQRLFNVDIWRWNNVEVSTLPQLSYATKIQRWFTVEEQRWNACWVYTWICREYLVRKCLTMTVSIDIWHMLFIFTFFNLLSFLNYILINY